MVWLAAQDPVVMKERVLGPPVAITGGKTQDITVDGTTATLFVPDGWKPRRKNHLWTHFHSAAWYVVSEYQRGQNHDLLLVFNLGQGSSVYEKPFLGKKVFSRWVQAVESSVGAKVSDLNFSSFSAGYGAVRALVADPYVLGHLRTVILGDSMYGGLDPKSTARKPDPADVLCWKPLAERAIAGKTSVIMTTSQITPPYAGTWEVARALVEATGGVMQDVRFGDCPASTIYGQRLLRRYDKGKWHVWSYAGETPEAHMTHARRLAEELEFVASGD
ncbi:MAG: hypothetical protein GC165_08975 [Armatimonadetes bacterium]|nr:hypothetical protein [Armatimonadota bacterium]